MASKKTTTKKSTSAAKKTTTKKVATPKAQTKKTTVKKVEPKKVEKKEVKMEVKPVVKVKKEKINVTDWLKENYIIVGIVVLALLLIINIIIVSVGHKVKLQNGKEVIASINGKQFIAEELFDTLKEKYGNDALLNKIDEYIVSKEISDNDKVKAKKDAQSQIDTIKSQYESVGYKWEEVLAQYGYTNEEALLNEMTLSVEKETVAKNYLASQLTDEEITKYYNENVFGKYTAKHILIVPAAADQEEAAKAKAEEVINRLNNGEDFDALVKEYSEDTGSKDNNGLVENFTKGDVVDEFWNAVEALEDGKYTTEPVKSSYGYHVIYRVSYTEKKSLDEMKDSLVDEIVTKKLNDDSNLYTQTWVKLRNKYKLEINDTIIKSKYENTINESE